MLKMSFYDGTLDKKKAIEFINATDKEIKYTHGLGYRNPTTHLVPISKEKAVKLIKEESLIDVKEQEDYIDVNTYSSNDMY